jgi:AcrR family transcriptional regulator
MPEPVIPSRRERLRAQTLAELKDLALAQIAEGGPAALSLNAIARSMGMSGPGLYRYFASRDDLLAALVADSYDELADALEAAGEAARRRAPAARFRAVTGAYREWALAHPHQYRLVFSTVYGSGQVAPDETIPRAHRSMLSILAAGAALGPAAGTRSARGGSLDRQLKRWSAARGAGADLPAATLRLGVLTWTRLHGVLSLEIEGVFEAMGLDAALIYDAEVEQLIAQHRAPATSD